jgi:hypothetical protein
MRLTMTKDSKDSIKFIYKFNQTFPDGCKCLATDKKCDDVFKNFNDADEDMVREKAICVKDGYPVRITMLMRTTSVTRRSVSRTGVRKEYFLQDEMSLSGRIFSQ